MYTKKKVSRDLSVATLVDVLPACGWASPKSAPAVTHYKWDCFADCWQWILHHSPAGFKESASDDQLRAGRAYVLSFVRGKTPPAWAEHEPIAIEVPITIVLATAA